MNDNNQNSEQIISQDWLKLETIMSEQVKPLPDEVLDRQILAAAHREISQPKKRADYQVSWRRKLSLPLYVAAGFTFTVFALKPIWQVPGHQIEQTEQASQPTSIQIGKEDSEQQVTQSSRVKRELPQLQAIPDIPETTTKERVPSELIHRENDDFSSDIKDGEIYTGTHLSKAVYPEKEAWARKIINFMKNGDDETARMELIRFKKVYPDYPIEEQIKVLNR